VSDLQARLAELRGFITKERCKRLLIELMRVPSPQTALMESEPLLRAFIETAVEPRLRRTQYKLATKEAPLPFKIIKPDAAPQRHLEPGRGTSIRLIDTGIGVESLDVHMNVLAPRGPRGRLHRHTRSDNVYIVKFGEGLLTIENEQHAIVADDVVFIPAGTRHSLSNVSDGELVIYEIYSPAGAAFDFIAEE
jgi:mannose-6-phosphate isomerase-like protein (cupin superfamily)